MTDWKARAQAAEAQVNHYRSGVREEIEHLRTGPWAVKPTEQADRLQALLDSEPGLPEKQGEAEDDYVRSGLAEEVIERLEALELQAEERLAHATEGAESRGWVKTKPAEPAQLVAYTEKRIYRDAILIAADTDAERHFFGTGKEVGVGAGTQDPARTACTGGDEADCSPAASVDSNLDQRGDDELLGVDSGQLSGPRGQRGGASIAHPVTSPECCLTPPDQVGQGSRIPDQTRVAGAAVDVGGGPENSTSPRSSSEEQRSSNPQAPGSNPGGGTEARGVTSRRNTSTQESKPPRPGNDGPGGPESRVTRAEVPAAPQQQTSHVEGEAREKFSFEDWCAVDAAMAFALEYSSEERTDKARLEELRPLVQDAFGQLDRSTQPVEDVIEELEHRARAARDKRDRAGLMDSQDYWNGKAHAHKEDADLLRKHLSDGGGKK